LKLRGIGDVVLSTIVIDNLRNDFPSAEIDYLVEKPSRDGLTGLEGINEVLIFDRKSLINKAILTARIRNRKYDLIFDFFTNPSTALITFLSGAKFRVGFPYRGRKYAYNLFGPPERGKYHAAMLHLETLKLLDLSCSSKNLHYYINPVARGFADQYLRKNFSAGDFVIGICPAGGWPSKKCDPEKFAEIGERLIGEFKARILILWGKSDEEDAEKIYSRLGPKSVLAPSTSIQELAALISRLGILVANDSGPMHISTAVGTPVLSLHGPTSPQMQGPFGEKNEWVRLDQLECIECNLLECPRNHECFRDLPVEKVIDKVKMLIYKNRIRLTD
jgi:ADP-heptose:LPS heptosyltransferase